MRDSKKRSKLTGRFNIDWTPNDQTLVYLSYTTGYRSGGFGLGISDARTATPTKITPYSYDLEEIRHTELGYKGEFFDNTLQLFSSIYIYDYSRYQDQVTVFDPVQLTHAESFRLIRVMQLIRLRLKARGLLLQPHDQRELQ